MSWLLADLLARGGPEAEAYEQALLTRLVALNHERAAEEQRGLVRWLRPGFQAPEEVSGFKFEVSSGGASRSAGSALETENLKLETLPWPSDLPAQVAAIRKLLAATGPDPEALAARFGRKNKKRVDQITGILATLKALGHIQ